MKGDNKIRIVSCARAGNTARVSFGRETSGRDRALFRDQYKDYWIDIGGPSWHRLSAAILGTDRWTIRTSDKRWFAFERSDQSP